MPYPLFKYLFGNRRVYGNKVSSNDPDWIEWQKTYLIFYEKNQKQSIGKIVNNSGYNVLEKIDFTDKDVIELGPGKINHLNHWNSLPKSYSFRTPNGLGLCTLPRLAIV